MSRFGVSDHAGPKEVAPTSEEIEALQAEQPIMLNVHFTDDSLKTFIVDDDLTVHELLTAISTTLKVKSIETYSLYDVSTISDPVFLEHKLKVMNVMQVGGARLAAAVVPMLAMAYSCSHPYGEKLLRL